MKFKLHTPYQPTGDQPQAIKKLVKSLNAGNKHQTLLGVTGSGKTFTMANIIEQTQKPTLVMAHNKTLAAQLYQEFRDYFPENAVSYFVSYYDYYQPEAYIPSTDTYIEKEADINDEIDKLRLSTTTNLLTRPDTIVVASVSCIYNIGAAEGYDQYVLRLLEGEILAPQTLFSSFTDLMYQRSQTDLRRGTYRVRGDTIQIWPANSDTALTIEMLDNEITKIREIDPVSGALTNHKDSKLRSVDGKYHIYPARHYTVKKNTQEKGLAEIERDLKIRLKELQDQGKILEAHRLNQKVNYDMEMIREFGFVNGIENYSRHFDGRKPGEPPNSLLGYFELNRKRFNKDSFLTIIDESHMSIPQIRGMYRGDQARKNTLIDYGFRLPSALDNRPLRFPEFLGKTQQNLYASATPADWELEKASPKNTAEQLIRPTGLIDPIIELRPIENQVEDLVIEILKRKQLKQRVLVTTLTKKMAEALTDYLNTPEKITQLINTFNTKDEITAGMVGQKGGDLAYQQSESLPINEIEIGPLTNHYYKRLSKLKQIPKPENYPKVMYLHSDIDTLERSDILDDLRRGEYDVLIGINLLREGLDLPEVGLVAILDADKEGFLRSKTSMVQTMGRAARHENGRALLFADKMTKSMKIAITETQRRREIQVAYNLKHNITPTGINKPIRGKLLVRDESGEKYSADGTLKNESGVGGRGGRNSRKSHRQKNIFSSENLKGSVVELKKGEKIDLSKVNIEALTPVEKDKLAKKLKRRMQQAAKDMDYELAAMLRDKIAKLVK